MTLTLGATTATCALFVDTSDLSRGGGAATPDATVQESTPGAGAGLDGDTATVEPEPAVACPAAGHACVADAPDGWLGPLLVYDGPEDGVPDCPASMAIVRLDAHADLTGPPAACTACVCGDGSGTTCTATLYQGDSSDCSGAVRSASILAGYSCVLVTPGSYSVQVSVSGGSCPPSGGEATRPSVVWGSKVRACGAASLLRTGCADGSICAPDPPHPFKARHCVTRSGDVACPTSTYTEKLSVIGSFEDTRGCAACTCGAPQGTCSGRVDVYKQGSTCIGVPDSSPTLPVACAATASDTRVRLSSSLTDPSSTCAATGGWPTGAVTPADVDTVCCAR